MILFYLSLNLLLQSKYFCFQSKNLIFLYKRSFLHFLLIFLLQIRKRTRKASIFLVNYGNNFCTIIVTKQADEKPLNKEHSQSTTHVLNNNKKYGSGWLFCGPPPTLFLAPTSCLFQSTTPSPSILKTPQLSPSSFSNPEFPANKPHVRLHQPRFTNPDLQIFINPDPLIQISIFNLLVSRKPQLTKSENPDLLLILRLF